MVPHYCSRNILKALEKKFNSSNVIAITGITGSGKTQLVTKLVKNFRINHKTAICRKLRADTKEHLNEDLRYFTYDIFAINQKSARFLDEENIRIFMISWLSLAKEFVLIFDKASDSSLINDFVDITDSVYKKVIITSQNKNFFSDKENNFPIEGLNEDEVCSLLFDIIPERRNALIFAAKFNNLPLGLMCAKLFIKNNLCFITPDKYLCMIENEKTRIKIETMQDKLIAEFYQHQAVGHRSQLAACSLAIEKLNEKTRETIKLCSFLSADSNIPLTCFLNILKESNLFVNDLLISAIEHVKNFEEYSLVEANSEHWHLSFHSVVLSAARSLILDDVNKTLNCLLTCLNNSFDYKEDDTQTSTHASLVPHILSVISHASNFEKNDTIQPEHIKLLVLLSSYYLFENRNYKFVLSKLLPSTVEILPIHHRIKAYNTLAYANLMDANDSESIRMSLMALNLAQTNFDKCFTLCMIGHVFTEHRLFSKALFIYEKALSFIEKTSIFYEITLNISVGKTYVSLNQLDEAEKKYNVALNIATSMRLKENHPEMIHITIGLADIAFKRGNILIGIKNYNKAIEYKASTYGTINHPEIASVYRKLGDHLLNHKRYSEAKEAYLRADMVRKQLLKSDLHPDFLPTLEGLLRVKKELGEHVDELSQRITNIRGMQYIQENGLYSKNSGIDFCSIMNQLSPILNITTPNCNNLHPTAKSA